MDRKGGNLSGGERQMLLIAMALLGKSSLVLMDEPTEGLAPHVINDLKESIQRIRTETTLMIIEQNLPLTAEVADRVYAMKEGKVVAEIQDKQEIRDLKFERFL
jgi:ABC-type branched-subunit amino acid transport system ATPase component